MTENKRIKNLLTILLALLIILVFSKISYIFKPIFDLLLMFIGPLIIGGFIYYWLRPVVRKLSQGKMEKFRPLISILTILIFISIFVIIISMAGVKLTEQFQDTIQQIMGEENNLMKVIEEKLAKFNINTDMMNTYLEKIKNSLKGMGDKVPQIFSGVFSGIGDFTTQIALLPFVLFYLLKDEKKIGRNIEGHLPLSNKEENLKLLKDLDQTLSTYIVGQLLVALIIGGLMFVGYLIIGMPNALLMASFSVITAVIPLIGAFLGILPALLIAVTIGFDMVVKVILLSVIVQQLEGNIITPNLMGSRLNIHPFVVMLVVIISINLLGLFGAFIGIPLYLVISTLVKEYIKVKKAK